MRAARSRTPPPDWHRYSWSWPAHLGWSARGTAKHGRAPFSRPPDGFPTGARAHRQYTFTCVWAMTGDKLWFGLVATDRRESAPSPVKQYVQINLTPQTQAKPDKLALETGRNSGEPHPGQSDGAVAD